MNLSPVSSAKSYTKYVHTTVPYSTSPAGLDARPMSRIRVEDKGPGRARAGAAGRIRLQDLGHLHGASFFNRALGGYAHGYGEVSVVGADLGWGAVADGAQESQVLQV